MYQVTCLVPVCVQNSFLSRVNEFLTKRPVRWPVVAGGRHIGIIPVVHLLHSAVVVVVVVVVVVITVLDGSAAAAVALLIIMMLVRFVVTRQTREGLDRAVTDQTRSY
jgi:hypothetical protein